MKARACGVIAATLFATCPVMAKDARFDAVYESSAAAALPDGQVVVVDDEAGEPLHLVRIDLADGAPSMSDERLLQPPRRLADRLRLGKLDDLEGACLDAAGRVVAIGSHNIQAGIDDIDRRKLVRFRIDGDRMSEVEIRRDLRTDLLDAFPAIDTAMRDGGKHDRDLDIEGLACDTRRDRLLIGLRAPRLDGRAVIVSLLNPDAWLEAEADPVFELLELDLDQGGIRAMAYDGAADALLIVSRDDATKKSRYQAWWQDAAGENAPMLLELDDRKALDDVEGVTLLNDSRHVLFVRDDGKRKKGRTGSWFIVGREAFGLPGAVR